MPAAYGMTFPATYAGPLRASMVPAGPKRAMAASAAYAVAEPCDSPTAASMGAPPGVASNCTVNAPVCAAKGVFDHPVDEVWQVPIDAAVGLSQGSATAYAALAAIARFGPAGTIDARSGPAYVAGKVIPYAAGMRYHFRLVVDVRTHTYSAYVTPPGSTEQTIGTGLAFRTEQSGVTALANVAVHAEQGTHTVCNFSLTTSGPSPAPVASVAVSPATASVAVGQTVQLTATPKDASGTSLP